MDDFLRDPDLKGIAGDLSFTDGNGLVQLLHAIPHGIKDDQWLASTIEVESSMADVQSTKLVVRYRDIRNVIKYLLGHRPFKDHLVYTPIRQFNTDEDSSRVYDEMHTADWWWDTQLLLPPDATAVPLLIGTDKTMLTQHHGDESAWPVYITIGNLDRATRRNQSSTGTMLLGFIPVLSGVRDKALDKEESIKAHIYHAAMRIMLERMETL
jgi:hypothetical protein